MMIKNKRLLLYAFIIAGVPAFLLSLLATAFFRDFLEDNIVNNLQHQRGFITEQLAEHKLMARQYIEKVASDGNILDAFMGRDDHALDELVELENNLDFLVLVNEDGTYIYPPKTMVSSGQRKALELGEAKMPVRLALRYVSVIERNSFKIGAAEAGYYLDRPMIELLDQPGSELIFAEKGRLVASTLEGFETGNQKAPEQNPVVKEFNNRTVELGGQIFYVESIELKDVGLTDSVTLYQAVPQNLILRLLNSLFVVLLAIVIMVPVTFLTWGLFVELIEAESKRTLAENRRILEEVIEKKTDLQEPE